MNSRPIPTVPADPRAFAELLAELLPAIEATLDRVVPGADVEPRRIHEAMRYSLFAGGKRLRPALTVMAGDVFGLSRDVTLPGGAALELIHTYSLIHDDLPALDNDDLRRGRPSAHLAFDEALAVLAGDSLLTLGLRTLAAEPRSLAGELRRRAVEMVGDAIGTRGMIGGQVDDLAAEKSWPADAGAALEAIHRRKTGALLKACLVLAGIYADLDPARLAVLEELGEALGLLFQISDDILDVEGDAEALGKTAGKDAAARKLTYPGLYGLAAAKAKLAQAEAHAASVAAALPAGGGLFPALIRFFASRDR